MADATVVTDFVGNLITNCDSATADGIWTGVPMIAGNSDPAPLEGLNRLAGVFKNITDSSNDTFFAPTVAENLTDSHLRIPFMTSLKPILKTFALGGIEVILSDGSNTANYIVSGGDKYIGGWEPLVLDVNATPSSGTAPNMSALTSIGFIMRLTTGGKNQETAWVDYITHGDGLQSITGGTSGDEITFDDIVAQDTYFKIFEKLAGVYRCRGEFVLGSTTSGDCYFKDSGKTFFFDDLIVADTLYKLKAVGNAATVTSPDLSGISFSSETRPYLVDFTDANIDSVLLNGTTFQNATSGVNLSGVCEGVGTILDNPGPISPGTAVLTNLTVKNSAEAIALTLPATHNIASASFFSTGTGHAVSGFAVAGDYTLANFFFYDYAATDGSTGNEAVYVSATTGTVNITISGGTIPSIMSAGATVNVLTDVVVTIGASVSLLGAEVRIYDMDNLPAGSLGTELAGAESHDAATFLFSSGAGNVVWIQIMKAGFVEFGQEFTMPAFDAVFTARLRAELNS